MIDIILRLTLSCLKLMIYGIGASLAALGLHYSDDPIACVMCLSASAVVMDGMWNG